MIIKYTIINLLCRKMYSLSGSISSREYFIPDVTNTLTIGTRLGQDSYGTQSVVYKGLLTSNEVAVKIFRKNDDHFLQELKRYESLFKNGFPLNKICSPIGYSNGKLIFPLMEGDLFNDVHDDLSVQTVENIFSIAKSIRTLHRANIAHCDIKLENLLYNAKGEIKIGDFGGSKIPGFKAKSITFIPWDIEEIRSFSKEWMKYLDSSADIWAFGNIIFQYLFKSTLNQNFKIGKQVNCDDLYKLTKYYNYNVCIETVQFIIFICTKCLIINKRHRINIDQIVYFFVTSEEPEVVQAVTNYSVKKLQKWWRNISLSRKIMRSGIILKNRKKKTLL